MPRPVLDLPHDGLPGAPPLAGVRARDSGAVTLEWASPALADLLPLGRTAAGRPRLALVQADAARVGAAAALLVGADADRVDIEVGGHRGRVWLHLHQDRTRHRGAPVAGTRRERRLLLVATQAPPVPATAEESDDRSVVVGRLTVALLRLRRSPGSVVVAVAQVAGPRGTTGAAVGPELVERLRSAARDTDVVGRVGPDVLALVAEGVDPGGELSVGRRLASFLQHQVPDDGGRGVHAVVTAVRDADADPEAVLQHLVEQVRGPASERGLSVLPTWSSTGGSDQAGADDALGSALASGRFVLGTRQVTASSAEAPDTARPVLVEVSTDDDGRLSPVRVASAGLAAALDGWLLDQVDSSFLDGAAVAVRLQPGGTLSTELGAQVVALASRRPGLTLVLQVPEPRLAEALGAERSVLHTIASAGVGLGVAAWTGLLPPPTLVANGVSLVELAADVPRSTLTPVGSATVAALCAAVSVVSGSTTTVVADRPDSPEVALALAGCGVRHQAPIVSSPLPRRFRTGEPR